MADADGKNKKGCCEKLGDGFGNFCTFLYNRENGMVMGRSGKSWAKIGFFYLIFYGFLAGFFSGMLAIFLSTLNAPGEGGPKLTQYVANQPGLNRLDVKSPLMADSIIKQKTEDLNKYKEKVEKFLNRYNRKDVDTVCNSTGGSETGMGEKECKFDTKLLGDCQAGNLQKLFDNNMTCVYVKINKVYDWVPKSSDGKTGFLELECNNKKVNYHPAGGYQIAAFPFRGQENFELPVVALRFNVHEIKTFDCNLKGKDIELSESVMPHRAFGRIRIKV